MKQTAVEWLGNELDIILPEMYPREWDKFEIAIQQAKEMEKGQMIDTFVEGMRCQNFDPNRGRGEQYYNATFNTNNK